MHDINDLNFDDALALSSDDLDLVLGGSSNPSVAQNDYGMEEFRQDFATIASAASLGNIMVPGGPGAAGGAAAGALMVLEHRFDVSGHFVDAGSYVVEVGADFVSNVAANEELHRSNII